MLVIAAALLGALLGWAARAVVLSGRYRRPDDAPHLRSAWWAPLAGAAACAQAVRGLDGRPWPVLVAALPAVGILVLLALVDLDVHRLPTVLIRPLALGLLALDAAAALRGGAWWPLTQGLAGGLALYLAFYLLAAIPSGFGYGDVRLAGALGLGLGPLGAGPVVTAPALAVLLGGLAAMTLLLTGRAHRTSPVPFGPALVAGALLALGA